MLLGFRSSSGILVGPGDCVSLFTSGKQLPLLAQIIRFRKGEKKDTIQKFKGRYFYWKEELPAECKAEYRWAKDEIIALDHNFTGDIASIENLISVKPVEHFTWGDDYYYRVRCLAWMLLCFFIAYRWHCCAAGISTL